MQNRIGVVRRAKGMSQTELAEAVGTTRAQIYRLEKGKRGLSLDWMTRVARALDVKVADLLPTEEGDSAGLSPEEEILNIISQLPERDKLMLVYIAREVLQAMHRWNSEPNKSRDGSLEIRGKAPISRK